MIWSREQRYQDFEKVTEEHYASLRHLAENDPYYPRFHIAPKHGLLNDPNGLCFFNGEHHIFYQWFPLGPVHGKKCWYHVSTSDFVNFKDRGIALNPNNNFDSHGCYSGSALVEGQQALLFYTGNKRDENWVREPTQCYATMDTHGNISKKGVILKNDCFTEHFRDPKVWRENDHYYMVVGAQTKELKGRMALYEAKDINQWYYKGLIKTQYDDYGYMWECPDYFELDGRAVILFSPQGVDSSCKYELNNIFGVSYILGDSLNKDVPELINPQPVMELDSGFDFYAPQTYMDESGRRILLGWIGLPDIDYPNNHNQWAHMLSIPRELSVESGYLIQTPLKELKGLRAQLLPLAEQMILESRTFEIEIETELDELELTFSNKAGDKAVFRMNPREFELDRSAMSSLYAEEHGTKRYVRREVREQKIQLFFDHSVLEIFLNNGRNTMTSRIFIEDLNLLSFNTKIEGNFFYLNNIKKEIDFN